MEKTRAFLTGAFSRDLALLTLDYIMADVKDRNWRTIAKAGEWETCQDENADMRECLTGAFEGGHLLLYEAILARSTEIDWNDVLHHSCMNGWQDMFTLAASHGANDWDFGLGFACEGGHLNLAKQTIIHGACDFDWGLSSACEGGHLDLVELMIACGANDLDRALLSAYAACRRDIIDLIILYKTSRKPLPKTT